MARLTQRNQAGWSGRRCAQGGCSARPLGSRQLHRELDESLVLEQLTVPLGVVGVIFRRARMR